ncbi:hypothetical protein Psuf_035560 [Phytohabitans suffuscus]|uniref:Aminotransferase class V domain-containing protein n=1 Tax=Phytohabitans suffuscus TaxID=624315 RepID=A0A6F8YJN1_9ACTN|nr:hypothetical protein Psuf_035560 [Phytohabitans suffuscus]
MAYDVSAVRATYPALSDGYAYLDGAAGTQVPEAVIEAIASAYRRGSETWAGRSRPATGRTPSSPRLGQRSPTWSAATPGA